MIQVHVTKKMKKMLLPMVLATAVLSLGACDTMKRELGMGRHSPDEFAVVKRAPLSLPPDYALRPPSTDYLPPASESTQQARTVLMGEKTGTTKAGGAETAFLEKAGAYDSDPAIRAQINRDNGFIALENRTVADRLIFWEEANVKPDDVPASVVDAKAEAERLQKNKAEGNPLNAGQVPVIEKKKSTFEKIF